MEVITVNSQEERIDAIGERLVDAALLNMSIPAAIQAYGGEDSAIKHIVGYLNDHYEIKDHDGTDYEHVARAVQRVVEEAA